MTQISSSLRYGSRGKFMIELTFDADPEPACAHPEERASWGGLKLWADDFNLCVHYEDGELRDAVNWNWWSLLQWLTESWDFIFHEQALPVRNAGEWAADAMRFINRPESFERAGEWDAEAEASADAWFRRHCLWACRQGGLLPNVAFRRFFNEMEVSWTTDSPPGSPTHYNFQLTNGGCRLQVEDVAGPLHQFLMHASEYVLAVTGSASARALIKQVRKLAEPTRGERRLAILAGLGTKAAWHRFVEKIESQISPEKFQKARRWFIPSDGNELFVPGTCQASLMFGAYAPAFTLADRMVLAAAIVDHTTSAGKKDRIAECSKRLPAISDGSIGEPWQEGYELASAWAEASGMKQPVGAVDIEGHLQELGVTLSETDLSDKGTSGVAVAPSKQVPLILLNKNFPRHKWDVARRFTMAHELCHLIADRQAGAELAMASGPWAPLALEKRANAFAAALLMPDDLIKAAYTRLGSHPSAGKVEELRDAARILAVSADALSQHLYNRGFIDESTRDLLRSHLGPPADDPKRGESDRQG